jgi:hypothetical protein
MQLRTTNKTKSPIYTQTHTRAGNKAWAHKQSENNSNPLSEHDIDVNAGGEARQEVYRVRDVVLPVADVLLVLGLRSQPRFHQI